MHEVGERYDALEAENYDLALYHWEKIKVTIDNGLMKRPARKANADSLLLDATWEKSKKAFASRDKAKAWQGFELARSACMGCHEAEKVGFVNNQPLFTERVGKPQTDALLDPRQGLVRIDPGPRELAVQEPHEPVSPMNLVQG